MQIIRDLPALDNATAIFCGNDESLAFVPTMGALHAGHLALIAEGKRHADRVAASIFVNPLQFGPSEDLDRYPRQEQKDAELLEAAGCDLLWLPSVEDIYPAGFATTISVKGISGRWEGEARPGHFDGVATVVARLLLEMFPNVAVFGEKDFQQLAVIRRLVTDLNLPIEVVGLPTVRDADGLALSSRNAYLSADERSNAVELPRALNEAADQLQSGTSVAEALAAAKKRLTSAGFSRIDYLALVNAMTLEPLDEPSDPMRLIAAATIGKTRLIDNIAIGL